MAAQSDPLQPGAPAPDFVLPGVDGGLWTRDGCRGPNILRVRARPPGDLGRLLDVDAWSLSADQNPRPEWCPRGCDEEPFTRVQVALAERLSDAGFVAALRAEIQEHRRRGGQRYNRA